MWACLRVRLLADSICELEGHIVDLKVPPYDADIIGLRLVHCGDVLLHVLSPPQPYAPDNVPSQIATVPSHPTAKIPPPLPLSKKPQSALYPIHAHDLGLSFPTPYTPPRALETSILHISTATRYWLQMKL